MVIDILRGWGTKQKYELELKFESHIEVTDSFQWNGSESRLITQDIVVNERLVIGGRKCVDRFPNDFGNYQKSDQMLFRDTGADQGTHQ